MVEDNERDYGRSANKNVLLKIVILGDGGVGKSCLMSRFISNHFDDHNFHTIGVEFMNKTTEVNGTQYTLQVCWDFIIFFSRQPKIFHASRSLSNRDKLYIINNE